MNGNSTSGLARLLQKAQKNLLWMMLGCYVLGVVVPEPGVLLRHVSLGLRVGERGWDMSAPPLLLAFLLFNAGLGVNLRDLRRVLGNPGLLTLGLIVNAVVPVAFAFGVMGLLKLWPRADETQIILVGLALIGSMPIAGASAAWTQNSEGNLGLSLGLVVASTILSPIVTPLVLRCLGPLGSGDYAHDLHLLTQSGTQAFLLGAVVLPSFAGIGLRHALPEVVFHGIHTAMKLANLIVLLLLNYSNAALSLPQMLRTPNPSFLALVFVIVSSLCALAFWLGGLSARMLRGTRADAVTVMYALGMNNNGTGLVLASTQLAHHPLVLVPVLLYNLVQQIAAGMLDARVRRTRNQSAANREYESAAASARDFVTGSARQQLGPEESI
jgi:BASS family bile acid:Na+ symporter